MGGFLRIPNFKILSMRYIKLAQKTTGAKISCFFYEVGLSDQSPQPLLHEEKTLTYPGFEPGTFGFQVGNATN
jgi:hypothetical protein